MDDLVYTKSTLAMANAATGAMNLRGSMRRAVVLGPQVDDSVCLGTQRATCRGSVAERGNARARVSDE